jgi:beta-glucosidase
MAAKADAVVVAVGFDPKSESEASDRTFELPPGQDELLTEMAAANKNTIVAMTSGGAVDTRAWLDKIPALLQLWYPGQEGGRAFAEILFGDVNPSGRLPISMERRWEDNPVHDSYYEDDNKRVVYKEGVFVGYRGYERNEVKPLYPFGFGLSYTTFSYSNLSVTGKWEVSFDVTNTGQSAGTDVAQLYLVDSHAKVPRPAKELKGFARVHLKPGEKKRVTILLNDRSFCYFDAASMQWRADPGDFDLLIGRSSEDIVLKGKITLTAPVFSPR